MARHLRTKLVSSLALLLAVLTGCADALDELDNPASPAKPNDAGSHADAKGDADSGTEDIGELDAG